MPQTYIARVSINFGFAQERIEDLGSFFKDLPAAFPENMEAKITTNRFTFACYILKCETKEECRQAVYDAWEKVFGDTTAISTILIGRYYVTDMSADGMYEGSDDEAAGSEGSSGGADGSDKTYGKSGKSSGNGNDNVQDNDSSYNDGENSDDDLPDDDDEPLEIIGSDLIKTIYENMYGGEGYQRLITDLNETIPALKEKDAISVLFAQ
ncbi:MAG: hypothetical protein J6Y89_10705, partial [Lachnospiraceae bacterium]|nr:hypothetical protein [Lachnospiraceae bacterium]